MKRSITKSEKMNPSPTSVNGTTASTSTSASSSAADLAGKYEVFLSFRGTDTRQGFTDFLYNDLVEAGIRTFRDNEELRIGEEIGPDLIKAIEDSKISIPIFSKNYADSKWCLRELAHIVKCHGNEGRKIFPIFYDVDVYHVKNQKGSYEKAFQQHEKNFDKETVEDWRKALKTVGKLKGYELKNETMGHEGELVKKIVRDVLLELKTNYEHVPDELVGMDHHVQQMTRLLQVNSDGVRIVGIHGMGGIGKTTIAKAIYNKLCDSFDCCCFLEDVRERVKQHPNGLVDLQKQLVSKIRERDLPIIGNVYDGIKKIKDAVHKKKLLIVLDDVDEKSQFDKLAGECDWLDEASRIIVTTRNKDVLNALEATCSGKGLLEAYRSYEPELMTDGYSLKLFSQYAFMSDSPPKDYLILSKKVVDIARGLPLVLVNWGSLFLGIRDKASWSAKLKKLEKVPDKDVMGKLRISFDALDDESKKIFLDIACLFIGEDKVMPYYMWEGCEFVPEDGINTLVLRSLVKVGDDNKLRMHDQLRDLGRQIVREENLYKLSRVWHPEEALKVVEGRLVAQGVKYVEALILDLRAVEEDEYVQLEGEKYEKLKTEGKEYYIRRLGGENFNKLSNLRFLRLGSVILDGDFKNLFPNLSWLTWRCWMKCIPVNLNLKNLVIRDLSNSTITYKWEGWTLFKAATKLKALDLSGCRGLTRGPNISIIATFKYLESLNLHSCPFLLEFSGIQRLESLTNLKASKCGVLSTLGDLSNLKNLKELEIDDCVVMAEIQGLEKLESLEVLDMRGCKSIARLPELSNLRMLKNLFLSECKIREVKGLLGGLESLELLDMRQCESIERLPDLSHLRKLKKLDLTHCRELREIEGLSGLVSLESLALWSCSLLEKLPDLSNLKSLKTLGAGACEKLREIEGLSGLVSLETLELWSCSMLEKLPDLSNLKSLKTLGAGGYQKLHEIEGLNGLVSLETLNLWSCSCLEKLPDLSNLKSLKTLGAGDCEKLREIEGLSGLVLLETLELWRCSLLEKLPDLSNLKSLKTLGAGGCQKLREIEGLNGLVSLETLNLWSCSCLEKLPDLSNLKSLKTLGAGDCEKLREIEGLSGLVLLETLELWRCSLLEKLPDLSNLKSLKTLGAGGCQKLREIEGLSGLVSLETLNLWSCSLLEKLPDLSNLKSLKTLGAGDCEKLCEIEGLSGLVSLETLELWRCSLLEKLPDLSNLKSLKTLGAGGCEKLREIESLSGLVSLETLELWSCSLLEKLPDLSNLKSLKTLGAGGCEKLREIEGLSGLVSLETLNLSSCSLLEKLPDLSNLKSLKTLVAGGCDKLREIEGLEELKKRNCFIVLDGRLT